MENYDWEKPDDVVEALLTLYRSQTDDEQAIGETRYDNGIGFNAVDASILTSIAQQVQNTKSMSEKQYLLVRKLLPKYAGQLGAKSGSMAGLITIRGINTPMQNTQKVDGILKIEDKYLFFIPNVYPSSQVKELGFIWQGRNNGWRSTVSKPAIEGVKRLFSTIQIDHTVTEWLELNKPVELSEATTESNLFPFQKEAVQFSLGAKRAMLALAPGLGKTASAIFAGKELEKASGILVVCPLTLVRNWQVEIKKWIGEDSVIWRGNVNNWSPYDKWVITNYDTVVRNAQDIQNQEFPVIIVDESIMVKNRKAQRTKTLRTVCRSAKYVWLLSGSPTSRFLDDMWSQLNLLYGKRFSSYWRFVDTYCEVEVTQWGSKISGNQPDAIERLKRDISDIYFCRTQEEVLNIPDWIFDTIEVPMGKAQYKLYAQMEEEFIAELSEDDVILAPNVLSQMTRLLQFASNPVLLDGVNEGAKWNAVHELLEYEELPAIVWTQFIATANFMKQELSKKYRVATLTGQTKPEERQDIVDKFQAGELDVIIAHPAVGKFGLTLTAARTAIYMERSYNGDDFFQSLYRIKRIGTTKSPHVIFLLAVRPEGIEGYTIDHVINNVLDYRKNNSIAITTGMVKNILGKS